MPEQISTYWWGVEVCLDEDRTRDLLNLLEIGGPASSIANLFGDTGKTVSTIAGAAVKLGSQAIKTVDQNGGSHGVCIYQFWVGPACWVKARPV